MKRGLLRLLLAPGLRAAYSPLMHGLAAILAFHRFRSAESAGGYDPERLRCILERVRRERIPVVSLETLFRYLAEDGQLPSGCLAFTIDDGYADQANVAAPIFASFDVPVTTFVTTGFLDGRCWLWWDRIEFALESTDRRSLTLTLDDGDRRWEWESDIERRALTSDLVALCKTMPEERKLETLDRIEHLLEIHVPARPPDRYAPMTWDELRACRDSGMSFGPHSVTHPILSRVSDAKSREEIEGAWRRLREQDDRAVPIFAYPNGESSDYGAREAAVLAEAGFMGALTQTQAYAKAGCASDPTGRWAVPRFGEPGHEVDLLQITSGLEQLKRRLRGD